MDIARGVELQRFAARHQLVEVTAADLIRYRWAHERLVVRLASARMPTEWGEFTSYAYQSVLGGKTHMALVMGEPTAADDSVIAVHHECIPGDLIGACRCGCAGRLRAHMQRIATERKGIVVYLRGETEPHTVAAQILLDLGATSPDHLREF
jgi:3,4-dihydroxy 2-butanone 4-phosphate synthase/GTP cyclohydrolase II